MSDNVFSSRPDVRSILNELPHLIDVLSCYCFRNCQIKCNLLWNAQLIKLENGIWSNYSSGRKIHSLAHEVSTESTFLSSKTGSDSFQRLSRLVLLSWLSLYFVVHQGRNIILQILSKLVNGSLVGSSIDLSLKLDVCLNNLKVGIG